MRKRLLAVYLALSLLASAALGANVLAALLHHVDLLGPPQLDGLYEPFHVLYRSVVDRAYGSQFSAGLLVFAGSFALLSAAGFRLYVQDRPRRSEACGGARWMRDRELRASGALREGPSGGAILGQTARARFARDRRGGALRMLRAGRLIFSPGEEHLLVVAPSGRGKGVSVIVPTLLGWRGSVVVYDMKQENFLLTSGWRRRFSRLLRFDPTSASSARFNPLMEIDTASDVAQTQNLCELLTNPGGLDQEHDHWRATARQLLVGAVLHVLYAERDKSLYGVYRFLNDPESDIWTTLNRMLTTHHLRGRPHPQVEEAARNMLNKESRELSSVVSTASAYLSLYQDPLVARNTSASDFRLADLTGGDLPCSLYLCVSPESAARLRPLMRLMLEMIGNRLTRTLDANKFRLLFLMDEFPSLGRLPFFESQLAFFRQYGLRCMIVAQSFSQLFRQYGRDTSIIDNCAYKAILGVGAPGDAELLCAFLGSRSAERRSVSRSEGGGLFERARRGVSETESPRELLTKDELLRLPSDDLILLKDGAYPYRGKKIAYYCDARFKPRAGLPTIVSREDQEREVAALARRADLGADPAPRSERGSGEKREVLGADPGAERDLIESDVEL